MFKVNIKQLLEWRTEDGPAQFKPWIGIACFLQSEPQSQAVPPPLLPFLSPSCF